MDEKYSQLDPDTGKIISDTLSNQARESFNKIVETDKWLTQHNFLVNAGGAVAVLGYLGSNSSSTFAIFPLVIFLVGIIASGIEIRGLISIYSHLHKDAIKRRSGFLNDDMSVREASAAEKVPKSTERINHWSGIISQGSFMFGSIFGVLGYMCSAL